ncbi:hypothetical protein [Methylocella sp.]|uniref:hypothetical protein n=1 Tax=Methylocella sp. TaxID=1978226 RepID=UPI003783EAA2
MSLETPRPRFATTASAQGDGLAEGPMDLRIGVSAFAVALAAAGLWMLASALLAPTPIAFPIDRQAATAAAGQRAGAQWAAWLGGVRGDLYARAAFAGADAAYLDRAAAADPAAAARIAQTRANALHAVSLAPLDGGAWLLLAELPAEDKSEAGARQRAGALLMSYFTAPQDDRLAAARLERAVGLSAAASPDLMEFMKGDLRRLLADPATRRSLTASLAPAYRAASPPSREAFAAAAATVDPDFARALRGEPPK